MKKFKIWANPDGYTSEHNAYMTVAINNFPGIKYIKSIVEEDQEIRVYTANPFGAGFIQHLSECDDIWAVEIKGGD